MVGEFMKKKIDYDLAVKNINKNIKKNINKKNIKSVKSVKRIEEISIENSLYFIFLLSIAIGVIGANITSEEKIIEIEILLEIFKISTVTQTFLFTFIKYIKYHILILAGGFIPRPNGIILSISVFMFRGISLGYTAGVMLLIYGISGILEIITTFFLPNLFFIPAYFLAMYFSLEQNFSNINKKSKRINKISRLHKKNTQKTYFLTSTLLIILGCIIEIIINK